MKVAHFAVFGPNRCGLYHTAKDLVLAEQSVGINAGFIGYSEIYHGVQKDGDFETKPVEWANDADILVRHSAIPENLQNSGIPIVMAMHGRPESSFRMEERKQSSLITAFSNKSTDMRYKAFVTFWPEYVEIWSNIIPKEKLFYVPPVVDLKLYNPENIPFTWGSIKNGHPNILIADVWRDDVVPFNSLFAAAKFAEKNGGVIHLIGITKDAFKPMQHFLTRLKKKGILGLAVGQVQQIRNIYTACDMVATPHIIATRIIRESLASGLPVTAGEGCKYTPYTANPMDVDAFSCAIEQCWKNPLGFNPRKMAEESFGFEKAGLAMKSVFEKILSRPKVKKTFINVGGHLGEFVRKFFREVDDADSYQIFSIEPDPRTFEELKKNIGHIKNVKLVNLAIDKFPQWLKETIPNGDKATLHINLNGGEYNLMAHLIKEDLTDRLDKCFIKLNAHRFNIGETRFMCQQMEQEFYKSARCKIYMSNKEMPFE